MLCSQITNRTYFELYAAVYPHSGCKHISTHATYTLCHPVYSKAVQRYPLALQRNVATLCNVSLCRCFLTLTQALALGYGGNPYGPAGTGKTESVKALGQALGRQVRDKTDTG